MKRTIITIIGILLLAACSTTKHLPEGEILYTGQKSMIIKNPTPTSVGEIALEEIDAALAKAPNNSLLGSSTIRTPFPFGLWFYNGFYNYKKGFGRWIFNKFGATPVLMSAVAPDIRQKAAINLLRDYGYFNGTVTYETFPDSKDPLKAKLQYTVDMKNPYFIDTVYYMGFNERTTRIMEKGRRRSVISPGEQFNVLDLDEERTRISELMRNVGCYYFRSDYMIYQADTAMVPGGHVQMRLMPVAGMPEVAEKPFHVGNKEVILIGRKRGRLDDSLVYNGITFRYHDKMEVRPNMLYRWLNYQGFRRKRQIQDSAGIARHQNFMSLYSLHRQTRIQERLANIGIFSSTEMKYTARDSAYVCDTLDARVVLALNKPYDVEFDFDVTTKSNNQTGPGAAFILTKNNVFRGGESWNIKLDGSYEWQTGGKGGGSSMDSYEVGLSSSLTFPRIVFPRMGKNEYDFPATSTFSLNIRQMNRSKYYKMLSFGGNATYEFQPKPMIKHSLTPIKLTFNMLRDPTEEFLELQEENPALYVSLNDQFIPSMEYTFTYDNASLPRVKNPIWWQTTLASAGNITSAIYAMTGKSFSEKDKKLFGVTFAQFLKLNTEFRYHYTINSDQMLAARIAGGVIWSYGNTETSPYSEQFYIGGANSVRAYAARNIGPGGYPPDDEKKYGYINHVGDIRLEANLEYRFRLVSDLHGAIFLDAGNVWLMREDADRPKGKFRLKDLPDQIALGTGVGLRYDLDFLVFRLDLGIGLHDPYDTGKSGYYNISKFSDSMSLHFAIGYPF